MTELVIYLSARRTESTEVKHFLDVSFFICITFFAFA